MSPSETTLAPADKSTGSATTLFVCSTCKALGTVQADGETRQGRLLLDAVAALAAHPEAHGPTLNIVGIECLSNCKAGCTAAIAAPGKWTYVVGQLDAVADAADLLAFACQHASYPDGVPPWRARPQLGRSKVIARVPPILAVPLNAAETATNTSEPEPAV